MDEMNPGGFAWKLYREQVEIYHQLLQIHADTRARYDEVNRRYQTIRAQVDQLAATVAGTPADQPATGPWQTGPLPDEDGALIVVEMRGGSKHWGPLDYLRLLHFRAEEQRWWSMNNVWTPDDVQSAISRWARIV